MAKGKTTNINTDHRYVFATLHIHGATYKVRSLLTAEGKGIKTEEKYWDPKEVAVMHVLRHQKGTDLISKGNQLSDRDLKQAA